MYTFKIIKVDYEKGDNVSILRFYDLRGPEKVSLDGYYPGLKECKAINYSISNLKQVIQNVANKVKFAPFRNHCLTRLMETCFTKGS
jgi:hypothetical protein